MNANGGAAGRSTGAGTWNANHDLIRSKLEHIKIYQATHTHTHHTHTHISMGNCSSATPPPPPRPLPVTYTTTSTLPPPTTGTCSICLDRATLSSQYTPEANEHYDTDTCACVFCADCIRTYVTVAVNDGKHDILCPGILAGGSCGYVLSAGDVKMQVDDGKFIAWQGQRQKTFVERFMTTDEAMRKSLGVDKAVTLYIERTSRASLKASVVMFKGGDRVHGVYRREGGPRYLGSIVDLDVVSRTAQIAYDDGDFWDACPFDGMQLAGGNEAAAVAGGGEGDDLGEEEDLVDGVTIESAGKKASSSLEAWRRKEDRLKKTVSRRPA